MPFKCFKYNFYSSSKRYHTAAKHNATAFFDSSFNYIKQNSHLLSLETISNGARNYPNPHPANSTTTNYLQFDYDSNNNILVNDDENSSNNSSQTDTVKDDSLHTLLSNPITLIFPYQLQQVSLAINKANYQQILKKVPSVNVSEVLSSSIKLSPSHSFHNNKQPLIQRHQIHTSAFLQGIIRQTERDAIESSPTLINSEEPSPKFFKSTDKIPDIELSDETFLRQQSESIYEAYAQEKYRRIHSHYMAIKRNNIVPPREIYEIVLSSIAKRDIDDTLDDKLSTMLNVYQDLIQHRIKPDLEIYSVVIRELLEASIKSSIDSRKSSNGADFFKIAIDIFNASNCSQLQNFDSHIIDSILIGMNLYPGVVNMESFLNILNKQENFAKNHIYYIGFINQCKLTNDFERAIELYEDFKKESLNSPILADKQFFVYASFISTLVSTGEITLATKFLDKLLSTIKNYKEFEPKLNMLLSSYILTLSEQNVTKALEIWSQFNSIDWIPEFSYEFYSNLLNQVDDFNAAQKIYNYMVCLPRDVDLKNKEKSLRLENILINPTLNHDSISRFLISAVQYDDKTSVLKIIKESFIRNTTFDITVYPIMFYYLNNPELNTRILNAHGLLMNNGYDFLSYLISADSAISPQDLFNTEFFQKLVENFKLERINLDDYSGIFKTFNSFFYSDTEVTLKDLELCASLIIEFHDIDNYYMEIPNQQTKDFKTDLTGFFKKSIEDMQLTIDNSKTQTIRDAIKLIA